MIFFKKKIIFIHIPRCGGTSIEKNLWKKEFNKDFDFDQSDEKHLLQGFVDEYKNKYQFDGLQHLTFHNIKKIYLEESKSFFKFSFIRNPYSRIASTYAGVMTFRKDLRNFLVMHKDTSFKNFLYLIKKNKHTHWLPMNNFFSNNDLNFLGRFENFNNDLEKLEKITNFRLIKKNFSGDLNFSEKYNYLEFYKDKECIDLVNEIYAEDFVRFNYNFDNFIENEKRKRNSVSMSPNLTISHKEKTFWRFVKKYIKKKLYLINNNISY
jgi:hypothetical protein